MIELAGGSLTSVGLHTSMYAPLPRRAPAAHSQNFPPLRPRTETVRVSRRALRHKFWLGARIAPVKLPNGSLSPNAHVPLCTLRFGAGTSRAGDIRSYSAKFSAFKTTNGLRPRTDKVLRCGRKLTSSSVRRTCIKGQSAMIRRL